MAAFDPEPIPDYGQRVEIGRDLLLDDLPAREEGKGYVSVAESSFVWKEGGTNQLYKTRTVSI